MEDIKKKAKEIGSKVAILLEEIASSFDSNVEINSLFAFNCRFNLPVLIERAISRLSLSSKELVYGVILLDRYINAVESVDAKELPLLLVISLNLAQKSLRDTARSMESTAEVVKMKVRFVVELERIFLKRIDYRTFVALEEFNNYDVIKKSTTSKL